SAYGGHPAVLQTVAMLLDRPFRLTRAPVPTVTFEGEAGGVPGQGWSGHVDWHGKPPAPTDHLHLFGLVHFTTVQPNGGGFTLVPGSHHVVKGNLNDAELAQRMFRQEFRDFPGLGPEQEMRAKAGDVLYYHPFMVHGASDNQSTRARKVLHTHYFPVLEGATEDRAAIEAHFHPDHLAAMDERFRKLIGLA
ncbi:MAG TPA: phytanoyl-CoA dioxygenase family protein, partial [Abditibacteriaceae bacterium]|nr:phytanoyl-CoA dioxygenase family protein [Abditibacteriaceae bacterium]